MNTNPSSPVSPEGVAAATSPAGAPGISSEFQPLDPRVIKLWRVNHLIGTGFLLLLTLVPGVILGLSFTEMLRWIVSGWLAIAALRFWLLFWYPPRAYRAWSYRIDGKVLETRSGIWFRVTQLLPLSRLQHVDLHSGPVERSFGLASLMLHTAGTHNATIVIPGLDASQAARLRDHLVAAGGDDGV